MSTILDALKKSEQERRLNNVPTLSDMPTPQETQSWPTVLLFVVIFLLLALILLLVFRPETSDLTLQNSELSQSSAGVAKDTPSAANQPITENDILVNVVSYSEQAEQSFVMINGKLFRQGEFVRAGLKVEKIKFDEVILNLRGRRITRKP